MAVQGEEEIVALDAGAGEAEDLVAVAACLEEFLERRLREVRPVFDGDSSLPPEMSL